MTRPAIHLRGLIPSDLPFADSLRALVGWNQTMEDWRRFLSMAPEGCFLAEWEGEPAGTATTISYGREVAWIGMVLVHPDYRRRGIGNALLKQCVEHLRRQGVECIKLDATPAGKSLYDGMGFQDEWTLARWERAANQTFGAAFDRRIRAWREEDAAEVLPFDKAAFGASRLELLRALARQSSITRVLESEPGRTAAFGFARKGSRALYLGPVTAISPLAGINLVEALVAGAVSERIFWDIPDSNSAAVEWAQAHGLVRQRPLIRMFLGNNSAPSDPQRQFALAGPEVG